MDHVRRRSLATGSILLVAAIVFMTLGASPVRADDGTVGIVVRLADPSVAHYAGGTTGFAATSAEATGKRFDPRSRAALSYRARLAARQDAFVRSVRVTVPQAQVLYRYQVVLDGVALRVPAGTVDAIAALPGVVAVYRDRLLAPLTDRSPAFIGAKVAWKKLGGQDAAGEGVVVGVIDTGVWPEHPSFADPDPAGNTYPAPLVVPACQFGIGANPGPPFACNHKLIGGYRFMAAYDACVQAGGCARSAGTFTSVRDDEGHGTHTASTAAGNGNVAATLLGVDRGNVSGIAPRAQVIAYKVCGESGCLGSDCAAAVEQSILDGVDVINFSIAGGTAPYADEVELAFFGAYAAGIFVAASAGNSGPGPDTVIHRGPWVTTVGASTQKRLFASTLKLQSSDGAKLKVKGSSITGGIDPPISFVDAAAVGDRFCEVGTPDAAFFGKIVLCERGANLTRLEQSFNVAQRAGFGVVVFNPTLEVLTSDIHRIPTLSLAKTAGNAVKNFLALHPGVAATFTAGKAKGGDGDRMGAFSSRGGPLQLLGVSKPDITAPGVQILAGNTPDSATSTDVDEELFQAILGTSMSSPHVAGAAALVRALHPSFTPGQIKSTLMTLTSAKQLLDEDGKTRFDPFDAGSGRLALQKIADVSITFDAAPFEFEFVTHLWDANTPSLYLPSVASTMTVTRTAHNVRDKPATLKLKVAAPDDLTVTVPASITVPAGGDTAFQIGIDVSAMPAGAVRHATIFFRGAGTPLRFPVTVRKVTGTTTLYGGHGFGSAIAPGGLVRLDQAIGSATLVGDPVTPGGFAGMAFTSTGVLYGVTNDNGTCELLRIDPDTGALLATIGEVMDDPVFGVPVAIGDLAVQPGTDVLFGIRWNGDGRGRAGRLYTIDKNTAVASLVGDTGTCEEGGLAFAPDGTLYFTGLAACFSSARALHVLNPATAAIISSVPLDEFFLALAVRPTDGTLFAANGDRLFEIDPATGVDVWWGQATTGVLADLAFR